MLSDRHRRNALAQSDVTLVSHMLSIERLNAIAIHSMEAEEDPRAVSGDVVVHQDWQAAK